MTATTFSPETTAAQFSNTNTRRFFVECTGFFAGLALIATITAGSLTGSGQAVQVLDFIKFVAGV